MGDWKQVASSWEIAQIDTKRIYQDEHLVEAVAAIGIGSAAHRLTFSGITTEEDFVAIVRLVAAAPELLEALLIAQRKLSVFARNLSPLEVANDKEFDFIRATIAKARAA